MRRALGRPRLETAFLAALASAAVACLLVAPSALARHDGAVISFTIADSGVVGSGLMVETGATNLDGSANVIPAAIRYGAQPAINVTRGVFGTKHLTLTVIRGRFYPQGHKGWGTYLSLRVKVTSSDDAGCAEGAQGIVDVYYDAEQEFARIQLCGEEEELQNIGGDRLRETVNELRCTQSARLGCSALAQSTPTLAGPPTKVTLTVNGWTLTATTAKAAVYLHHEQDQPLASETQLTIRASIDHPLPKGWTLIIYHNGDVLSQGNGVWHKVCEIDGPSTATSCGDSRPGRIGPFDDIVWAAVSAPTYLAMHSDIYFHFNPPA